MKDKYDIYLQVALKPTYEPDLELNKKIIAQSKKNTGKRRNKVIYTFAKIAAAIIILAVVVPTAVYAAEIIAEKYFVAEHSISTGNQEYVKDEWIIAEEEPAEVEQLQYEEGDASVNWTSKRVECVNGYATNTYYYYDDYEKGIADSGLDNWLNTTYTAASTTYVLSEVEDFIEEDICAEFVYHDGTFYLSESMMTGNVASDCAHSIALQNTHNSRVYVSSSGQQFVLVDEITGEGDAKVIKTYVMLAYNQYYGHLSFENLSEKEIKEILDTVCVDMNLNNNEISE